MECLIFYCRELSWKIKKTIKNFYKILQNVFDKISQRLSFSILKFTNPSPRTFSHRIDTSGQKLLAVLKMLIFIS